jgi:hypothetical protein
MTEIMTPEGIERAFARREPWWKRLRTRVSRALIADEEESARLSAIDLEVREREGKAR